MRGYEDLRQQIEDELGVDIYHVHTGGRYLLDEALIGHFILALVLAYVAELTGLADLARRHRERLGEFIQRVRAGGQGPTPGEASSMKAELDELAARSDPESSAAAREELRKIFAEEMGMPSEKAEKYADRIGGIILAYVKGSKAA